MNMKINVQIMQITKRFLVMKNKEIHICENCSIGECAGCESEKCQCKCLCADPSLAEQCVCNTGIQKNNIKEFR